MRVYPITPKDRLRWLKRHARVRGIAFEITDAEALRLIEAQECYWCGQPPKKTCHGLDRRNNEPYYRLENTVTCCAPCNRLKGSRTAMDWIRHAEQIITEEWFRTPTVPWTD